jgi:hypothetical protein
VQKCPTMEKRRKTWNHPTVEKHQKEEHSMMEK